MELSQKKIQVKVKTLKPELENNATKSWIHWEDTLAESWSAIVDNLYAFQLVCQR